MTSVSLNKLQKLIKSSRLTQKEIAKRAGVTENTIQFYANGRVKSSQIDTIQSILGVLNKDLTDLYDLDDDLTGMDRLTYAIEDMLYEQKSYDPAVNKIFDMTRQLGTLGVGLEKNKPEITNTLLIEDAIGKIYVNLVAIAMQTDTDIIRAVQNAYEEMK